VAERFVVDAYLNEKYGVEPITVIAPNGGDVYSPGEEIVISWKAATVNSVNLFYSTDGGRSWEPINARRSVNHDDQKWGSYPWTVPQTHAEHCLVRVEDYTNSNVFDVSDNRFSIGTISAANNRRSLKAGAFLVRYRRGKLHVSGLVPSVNTAVHLYDCRGGLVARWHGENRENATVDLSGAGSGIYHAIVKNGERRRIVSFTHAR
jgi:hypothetical protein